MQASRNYIVLGANGGIGSVLCRALREAGHQVTLVGRNESELKQLSKELDSACEIVDATAPEQVKDCFDRIADRVEAIDGAVNCVGSLLLKPAHLTTAADWEATIATNLSSAFATVRAATPLLSKRGGSIVLVSSAAASVGLPNHEAIAAAKAGVIGLARSAAATYAKKNVRINVVAPGLVRTKLTERLWRNDRTAARTQAMHAIGRLGEPEDIASQIAWLLTSDSSWVTGQVIGVDGGLATLRTN